MKVSPLQPFQMVYALFEHQYLGHIFESFVIQVNTRGQLTYQYQNVSHKNIDEFAGNIDKDDIKLVHWMDEMQQEAVAKKFNKKKLKIVDFFLKTYDKDKGDKQLQTEIDTYMEHYRSLILPKLMNKKLFIMGKDGNPIWQPIEVSPKIAQVYFHFDRQEEQTLYYPNILADGERVKFQFKKSRVICEEPAFLLVDTTLYRFKPHTDGKKIKPFLERNNIVISRKIEEKYFKNFVAPLIGQFKVYAKGIGFTIQTEELPVRVQLVLTENRHQLLELAIGNAMEEQEFSTSISLELQFVYGERVFPFQNFTSHAFVEAIQENEAWTFLKIPRNTSEEKRIVQDIAKLGLPFDKGAVTKNVNDAFTWLQKHALQLEEMGVQVIQRETSGKNYFLGHAAIRVEIEEKNDWFDIKTKIRFGEFEIAFIQLRKIMKAGKREFLLPNGQIAVIPEIWFTQYEELFSLSEEEDGQVRLNKYHLVLVQDLALEGLAHTVLYRKLNTLQQFEEIAPTPLPSEFVGTLRPYQKAGYDWLHFLHQYQMGGCLADDMGLGKTVMTLAFLQSIHNQQDKAPSLLIMPTSLIYNWQKEAEKFAPNLRIYVHAGTNRVKDTSPFEGKDLVFMSYGVLRLDIDFIKKFRFTYTILDESQAIKNPASTISMAVRELNSYNRLILTGTPLENSTMDLWSQISFINPGLLGTQTFFKTHYQLPIEKKQDEEMTKRLFRKIKPFMLRRHKSQVATELPEKVESIQYSTMTDEQEKEYEETKSHYRNLILEHIEKKGMQKSQMIVLEGLTKLRQLANDPRLIDPTYEGSSGKRQDVIHKLTSILKRKHKILIFSQFVKHLQLIKGYLETEGIPFCYLDGATTNRQAEVERFQTDENVLVFLISLKAGGVGLNLTAAEYVFLLDPWWNPAIEAQAIDRAHRIGQTNTVFTYKFITKNTVEEKIILLQQAKRRLFDELITTEETFVKALTTQDMLALLD